MATSIITDVKAYDELMATSFYERIAQNIDGFNAASGGAIRMVNENLTGDYEKTAFFTNISALSRRDDTSLNPATATKLVMDEDISVKVKRKYGPVETTRGAFRSMNMSPDEASVIAGQAMADETKQEMLNSCVSALDAALSGQTAVNKDVSGAGNGNLMSHVNLNQAMKLFGDSSSNIKLWVMSGAAYHDLLGNMLTGAAPQFNDSGISVYNGGVPTLGRPVLVTDSPALTPSNNYVVLGLTDAAALLKISEDVEAISHVISGGEQLITRYQGESAYNIQLKGLKWDVTNGGRNPTASALTTASNWDINVTNPKHLPGVRLVVSQ